MTSDMKPLDLRAALLVVLDQVDYTAGACGVTEMVGACLSVEVIKLARAALAADKQADSTGTKAEES